MTIIYRHYDGFIEIKWIAANDANLRHKYLHHHDVCYVLWPHFPPLEHSRNIRNHSKWLQVPESFGQMLSLHVVYNFDVVSQRVYFKIRPKHVEKYRWNYFVTVSYKKKIYRRSRRKKCYFARIIASNLH